MIQQSDAIARYGERAGQPLAAAGSGGGRRRQQCFSRPSAASPAVVLHSLPCPATCMLMMGRSLMWLAEVPCQHVQPALLRCKALYHTTAPLHPPIR